MLRVQIPTTLCLRENLREYHNGNGLTPQFTREENGTCILIPRKLTKWEHLNVVFNFSDNDVICFLIMILYVQVEILGDIQNFIIYFDHIYSPITCPFTSLLIFSLLSSCVLSNFRSCPLGFTYEKENMSYLSFWVRLILLSMIIDDPQIHPFLCKWQSSMLPDNYHSTVDIYHMSRICSSVDRVRVKLVLEITVKCAAIYTARQHLCSMLALISFDACGYVPWWAVAELNGIFVSVFWETSLLLLLTVAVLIYIPISSAPFIHSSISCFFAFLTVALLTVCFYLHISHAKGVKHFSL